MALNLRSQLLVAALGLVVGVAAPAADQGAAKVSARDQLAITVFGVEDLSGKFVVAADGTVTYPHLGMVRVEGLDATQVAGALTTRLKDAGLLLNPQVTVELVQTPNKKVIVTGAVRSPGQLPFAGELTLFEALALSGSTTSEAGDLVLVVRSTASAGNGGGEGGHVIEVSRAELESGRLAEHNVTLQDGDQIVVPRAQQVFISGQVRSPGGYTIPSGTTVLQAVTLAGGLTDRGTMRGLKILRAGKELKNVKADTIVQPGDTIIVRASAF
jgi:polysaccharide export outer membrane protein